MDAMATTSPIPASTGSHFTSLGRRTSARQALRRPPSRPHLSRSETNPADSSAAAPETRSQSQPQHYSTLNDSSDDEIPVPTKLSALTKALLLKDGNASEASSVAAPGVVAGADRPPSPPPRPASRVLTRDRALAASTTSVGDRENRRESIRIRETRRHTRTASATTLPSPKASSPLRSREASPAPRKRVVRLSGTPGVVSLQQGGVRRSLSASTNRKRPESRDRTDERKQQGSQTKPERSAGINTPVAPVRTVRIAVGSSGQRGRSEGSSSRSNISKPSGAASDHELPDDAAASGKAQGVVAREGGSTSRHGARKDEAAPQSSMRVKRIGKVAGSFLSGPARRGRRRQSEEDVEDQGDGEVMDPNHEPNGQQPAEHDQDAADHPASSFFASSYRDFAASGSPVSAKDSGRAMLRRKASSAQPVAEAEASHLELEYKIKVPAHLPPPQLPSAHDKENEEPAGPNKVRPMPDMVAEKLALLSGAPPVANVGAAAPGHISPERKALTSISQNTPRRPAPAPPPPPPKMSAVETATSAAGAAAAAQATKRRQMLLKVNGRNFTRIDCVGRGGSSKVYRVSAENGNMLALKRVSLENVDENTVRGFKGEIDLLKRLHGVDRVIQLIDHELNMEKKTLSVLMELGQLDFYSMLKERQGTPEGAKFDPVFVRFYWKEMLECVQAVHARDVVHSDLKPANFVLVKGRLKLIDFGIANAIQTDTTVNVHREAQIGTPNYMSPESLMDSNQYAFTAAHNGRFCVPPPLQPPKGAPKLMKLGKPSDVWSLGCILYQMVYGTPPFGKIANPMSRCQAIINWAYHIDFPEVNEDGSRIPPSIIRALKRCLNREQKERPTCNELLAPTDPFLYPQEFDPAVLAAGPGKVMPMTEELLSRIIQSVVQRCKERLPTEGEAISAWPNAYWASVKKAVGATGSK